MVRNSDGFRVTINLPPHVYDAVRKQAEREQRSLNGQVVYDLITARGLPREVPSGKAKVAKR